MGRESISILLIILLLGINLCIHNSSNNKIDIQQLQITELIQTLNESQQQISWLVNDTERLQDQIIIMNDTIIKNNRDIDNYKALIQYKDELYERTAGVILNPTYDEVILFLDNDKTDRNEWDEDYDCTQFSHDVMRNALNQGMYSCVVRIDYDDRTAHNIIAFNTSDHGIQYFEPQTDENVYMYPNMDYAGYLGYSEDVSLIVKGYDSCFARIQ